MKVLYLNLLSVRLFNLDYRREEGKVKGRTGAFYSCISDNEER